MYFIINIDSPNINWINIKFLYEIGVFSPTRFYVKINTKNYFTIFLFHYFAVNQNFPLLFFISSHTIS